MRLVDLLSKFEIAAIRRLPFKLDTIYVPALGQKIVLPDQISSVFHDVFVCDYYRPVAPLPPNPTIVDLGSNLGLFVIYINRLVQSATIHAIEANPRAIPAIERNIALMKDHGNRVFIHNIAVTDYAGQIDFMVDQENTANCANTAVLDVSKFPDADHFKAISVACAPLSAIVAGKIDFLKCDIEGAEYSVLTREILHPDRVGQAVCEFHDIFAKNEQFAAILGNALANGFAIANSDGTVYATVADILDWSRREGSGSVILKFYI